MEDEVMKRIGQIMFFIGLVLMAYQILTQVFASYRMEKNYTQFWELADKSSTIPAKQKYIAQFVAALERGYSKGDFATHNAKWLQTPNNSFEANLGALKTLSARLDEIQEMKPSSFEYNTAIQQITAQEQGEARAMMAVFIGCYELANYPAVWAWIAGIIIALFNLLIFIGAALWIIDC
jgi:hypothetical protein